MRALTKKLIVAITGPDMETGAGSGAYRQHRIIHPRNATGHGCPGSLVAEDRPEDIVTVEPIREVYQIRRSCIPDPVSGRPMIVPTT